MFNLNLCSATNQRGKECMADVVEGAPVMMCMKHIMEIGAFWESVKPQRSDSKPKFTQADVGRKSIGYDQTETAVVYYIIHGNRIKIGTSRDWRGRLKNLPCDRVLALEPGGTAIEGKRHEQFSASRFDGSEWFAESNELWDHIVKVSEDNPEMTERANLYNKERALIGRARRTDGRRTGMDGLPTASRTPAAYRN